MLGSIVAGRGVGTRHDTANDDGDSLDADEGVLQLVYIGSPENGFIEAGRAVDLLERDRVEFVRTTGRQLAVERVEGHMRIGVPLPWVSGRHCELRVHGALAQKSAEVIDLESRNGTRVCGATVDGSTHVQVGDVIEVGRSFWMLRHTDTPSDPARNASDGPEALEAAELEDLPHPLLPERANMLDRAARSSVPVLLVGPTGGGKRSLAEWMHARSGRPGPFVALDIGSWPDDEVEAKLTSRRGALPELVASADEGTLCLRGIDHVAQRLQAHVRSLIAETTHARGKDVRLIATSTRDLRAAVASGSFRRELYARLSGFEVRVPALRERLDRLGVLIRSFYRGASGPELHVTTEAFRYALAYDWPYNVRQLHQALTTAMTIASREGWVGQPVLAEALEQQLPGLVASRRDSSAPAH